MALAELLNAPEIEAVAAEHGFTVVYPDELTFTEQVNLSLTPSVYSRPKDQRSSSATSPLPGQGYSFSRTRSRRPECLSRILPGLRSHGDGGNRRGPGRGFPHRSSYRIDPQRFRDVLMEWL